MIDGTELCRDHDWRLAVDVEGSDPADWLAAVAASQRLQSDLSLAFGRRIIASRDGNTLFFYGASRDQCEAVRKAVLREAQDQGWVTNVVLKRRHPYSEEWVGADSPMPETPADVEAETQVLQVREQAETASKGYPEFEVRVTLHSHGEARRLYAELREEGLSPVRRWRYFIVGVPGEVSGDALAKHSSAPLAGWSRSFRGTITAARDDLRSARLGFHVADGLERPSLEHPPRA
jgi:hypothetical protein